jgi:hypothetical protein
MMTMWMGLTLALATENDVIQAARGDSKADDYDAAVSAAMLATYDADGSGVINKPKELKAIPCTAWRALDDSVRAGWDGSTLRVIYGFQREMIWVGYALGIDEKLRRAADRQLERTCGL